MKVTIEIDGQRLTAESDDVSLSIPRGIRDVPCNCPSDCGFVHRELLPGARLELDMGLTEAPKWVTV